MVESGEKRTSNPKARSYGMTKLFVCAVVIGFATTLCAQRVMPSGTQNRERRHTAADRAAAIERSGGLVMKRELGKGRILFVNCQQTVRSGVIEEVADALSKVMRMNVVSTNGSFVSMAEASKTMAGLKANGAIFVVEDGVLPAMLSAAEDRWAVVNLKAISKGAEGARLENRLRCQLCRAFSMTFGWASLHGGMMSVLNGADDLDRLPTGSLGAENANRIKHQLKEIGLTPFPVGTYRSACVMGWAPPPKNDLQRKIWEEEQRSKLEYDRKEAEKKAKAGNAGK